MVIHLETGNSYMYRIDCLGRSMTLYDHGSFLYANIVIDGIFRGQPKKGHLACAVAEPIDAGDYSGNESAEAEAIFGSDFTTRR